MKRFYRDFRLALIVALIAFSACWLVGNYFMKHREQMQNSHNWLHEQLQITAEQDKKLAPIEQKFTAKKNDVETKIAEANRELALAINEDVDYSVRVKQAAQKIHVAQGELQKATLEHLFEMRAVLTPEQKKKLNTLTTDALIQNP
ncbi:MAG: periplasmic heavy metal sensor [Alphaproteobacteria bacterium]|nr:periplasmic heavy metal sensor [Alphaproteobacteria bacterium]